MKTISQSLKEELRDELLSLGEVCPVAQSNPEDCPLHLVRKFDPLQRFQWFDALGEHGLAYLASYHQVCLTAKLGLNSDGNIR
jgi:hypothetical protein